MATILDSASSGAVYVSFGATVKPSLMPTEKLEVFLQAFHEIKVSHVKYESKLQAEISGPCHLEVGYKSSDKKPAKQCLPL